MTENQKLINLRVIGSDNKVTYISIEQNDIMANLMKAYCQQNDLPKSQMKFFCGGKLVDWHDTPSSLNLSENNIIQAVYEKSCLGSDQQVDFTTPRKSTVFGVFATNQTPQNDLPQRSIKPGTSVAKFSAPVDVDTIVKGVSVSYIQTRQLSICFMREYAGKSIEELRLEDYEANRKGSKEIPNLADLIEKLQTYAEKLNLK